MDGGPGEQLRVAWRWLREDPRGPRAERARAFLAREGRREPLLRVRHLTGSGASLIRVAFTGDGAGLLTFGPAGLARWDLASGLGERFVAPGFVRRAARAPNGAWALGGEHRVDWLPAEALAAPEPGRPLRRLARWSRPAPRPLALAISPDGARVAVGLEEEGLLVLRAADGAPEGPVELPGAGRVSDVAFLDERRLVAAWTGPGASTSVLLGWDSEAGARWVEVTTRRVTAFALSADRTAVATGSALGDATLFDAASLEVRATLRDPALRGASLLTPGLFRTAVRDLAFSGERLLAVPAEGGPWTSAG